METGLSGGSRLESMLIMPDLPHTQFPDFSLAEIYTLGKETMIIESH